MKRLLLSILLAALLATLMIFLALKLPIPLATNSDFQVLYYTNYGLIHGVDIYDQQDKIQMISEIVGVPLEINFIPQFAYPPWFALSTFYLGLFPIQAAAVLWFEVNLLLIFLSVWYLTDGWRPLPRLLVFPAAILFLPTLGMMVVGQYDVPVLLGTSMLIYSVRHKNAVLTALSMVFLTFKPHMGALILLAGMIYLFLYRDDFAIRAFRYIAVFALLLFGIGFLADSAWPLDYFNSLVNYGGLGHITSCSECANLSVWLSREYNPDAGLSQASLIALILCILCIGVLIMMRPFVWKSHHFLINAAVLMTLIVSPYLYNYDYILLIIPFIFLLDQIRNWPIWIILGLCYLAPYLALALYGRGGNLSLIIITLVLFVLLCFKFKRVDVPAQPA